MSDNTSMQPDRSPPREQTRRVSPRESIQIISDIIDENYSTSIGTYDIHNAIFHQFGECLEHVQPDRDASIDSNGIHQISVGGVVTRSRIGPGEATHVGSYEDAVIGEIETGTLVPPEFQELTDSAFLFDGVDRGTFQIISGPESREYVCRLHQTATAIRREIHSKDHTPRGLVAIINRVFKLLDVNLLMILKREILYVRDIASDKLAHKDNNKRNNPEVIRQYTFQFSRTLENTHMLHYDWAYDLRTYNYLQPIEFVERALLEDPTAPETRRLLPRSSMIHALTDGMQEVNILPMTGSGVFNDDVSEEQQRSTIYFDVGSEYIRNAEAIFALGSENYRRFVDRMEIYLQERAVQCAEFLIRELGMPLSVQTSAPMDATNVSRFNRIVNVANQAPTRYDSARGRIAACLAIRRAMDRGYSQIYDIAGESVAGSGYTSFNSYRVRASPDKIAAFVADARAKDDAREDRHRRREERMGLDAAREEYDRQMEVEEARREALRTESDRSDRDTTAPATHYEAALRGQTDEDRVRMSRSRVVEADVETSDTTVPQEGTFDAQLAEGNAIIRDARALLERVREVPIGDSSPESIELINRLRSTLRDLKRDISNRGLRPLLNKGRIKLHRNKAIAAGRKGDSREEELRKRLMAQLTQYHSDHSRIVQDITSQFSFMRRAERRRAEEERQAATAVATGRLDVRVTPDSTFLDVATRDLLEDSAAREDPATREDNRTATAPAFVAAPERHRAVMDVLIDEQVENLNALEKAISRYETSRSRRDREALKGALRATRDKHKQLASKHKKDKKIASVRETIKKMGKDVRKKDKKIAEARSSGNAGEESIQTRLKEELESRIQRLTECNKEYDRLVGGADALIRSTRK